MSFLLLAASLVLFPQVCVACHVSSFSPPLIPPSPFLICTPSLTSHPTLTFTFTLSVTLTPFLSPCACPHPYPCLYLFPCSYSLNHCSSTSTFPLSPLTLPLSPLTLPLPLTGYEVPFVSRIDEVNKLYDKNELTTIEVMSEIDRLLRRDSTRLHGNDPFSMK